MNRQIAEGVRALMAVIAPGLPEAQRALVATVLVEATSSMLFVALRHGDERGAEIVGETKVLVKRYLEPYAGESRAAMGTGGRARTGKKRAARKK
jgi:hypothetical protein